MDDIYKTTVVQKPPSLKSAYHKTVFAEENYPLIKQNT